MSDIWEQQPGESDAAYVRFLLYRNLGPARSIDAAYQMMNNEGHQRAPGQWKRDSVTHRWQERAQAWDVHNLLTQGQRAAVLYVAVVELYCERLYHALVNGSLQPETCHEVTRALVTLSLLFPGEAIGQMITAHESDD